jgi:FAD/FMN-containing dehydrogenase
MDELIMCVEGLSARGIPFKVRGCAHSCGGQVLSDGGAVISTRGLGRILSDATDSGRVRVEGGALWVDVVRSLRSAGRRAPVVTGNLLTTVAGTLMAGGVGSTSHLHGLQIAWVTELVLVLPSGQRVAVGPQDDLFRFALAGAGQLGVIAQVELQTLRRPPCVQMRRLRWPSLSDFCEYAIRIREARRFEIFTARFRYRTASHAAHVTGHVGVFADTHSAPRGWLNEIWPDGPIPDLTAAVQPPSSGASPSLQFYLPLPEALDVWEEVVGELEASGLTSAMRFGSAICLLRSDRRFPVAPFPDSDDCLFVVLRPEVSRTDLARFLPTIHAIADLVLDSGGKLDLTSTRPRRDFVARQFGAALVKFRELKTQVDPNGLLNPGLLAPEISL